MLPGNPRTRSMVLAVVKLVAFVATTRILTQLIVFTGLAAISSRYWSQYDGRGLNEPWFLSSSLGIIGVTLLTCFLFLRFVDRKDWSYVRLRAPAPARLFAVGVSISFAVAAAFVVVAAAQGAIVLRFDPSSASRIVFYLMLALAGNSVLVLQEELITRGYAMKTLETGFNTSVAVVVTSLLFALMHVTNPNASILGTVNIFLMGCILALLCVIYGSLWLPIGLHFGWNFLLYLCNVPISGHALPNPLVELEYARHTLWTGSRFGPEDSLAITLLLVVVLGGIGVLYRRRSGGNSSRATSSAMRADRSSGGELA